MRPKSGPLLPAENHDRDLTARKILLIAHVPVGRQQHVEAVRLCGHGQQFAVLSLSHPCCVAVRTSCPSRKGRIGTGVAWSNMMRSRHLTRTLGGEGGRLVETAGCELDDGFDLFAIKAVDTTP